MIGVIVFAVIDCASAYELILRDPHVQWLAFAAWLLAPLLLSRVSTTWVYLAPLISWIGLSLIGASNRELRFRWDSFWFFDLLLLVLLQLFVLVAVRHLQPERTHSRV